MDPSSLPFPTIGKEDQLSELFKDLALYIYARDEKKPLILGMLSKATKYSSFNRFYWTAETIPSSVTNLVEFYLEQPILDQDRTEFLDIYMNPFMATGKRLKNLHDINPAVFTPVLDALIYSKRIQRIISQPNTLANISLDLKSRPPKVIREGTVEDYETEATTLRSLLIVKYEEQEAIIGTLFLEAQDKEPRFIVSKEALNKKVAANSARRKRKSRRGGKRSTRKVVSLRRRR